MIHADTDFGGDLASAFAALNQTGGKLLLGPRSYPTTGVQITRDDVTVEGEGTATRIVNTHPTNNTLSVVGNRRGIRIRSLVFEPASGRGASIEIALAAGPGEQIEDADILDVEFRGYPYRCIHLGNAAADPYWSHSESVTLRDVRIPRGVQNSFLWACNVDNVQLAHWYGVGSPMSGLNASDGIILDGNCTAINLTDVSLFGGVAYAGVGDSSGAGLKVTNTTGLAPSSSIQVNQCYFDSYEKSLLVEAVHGADFSLCWFNSRPGGPAAFVTGGNSLTFGQCRFYTDNPGLLLLGGDRITVIAPQGDVLWGDQLVQNVGATNVLVLNGNAPPPLPPPPPGTIIDDSQAGFSAPGWVSAAGSGFSEYYLSTCHYVVGSAGNGPARWTFPAVPGKSYRVSVTWVLGGNRATNAQYSVASGGNVLWTGLINQQSPPAGFNDAGAKWQDLGTFTATGQDLTVTLSGAGNGYLIADAVRLQDV